LKNQRNCLALCLLHCFIRMEPKEGLVRLATMVLVLQGAGCAPNPAAYPPCRGEMDQKLVVLFSYTIVAVE